MKNLLFMEECTWLQTWPHIQRGKLGQIPLVFLFPSCIYLELFSFDLILKCGGLHIMGLCGRTMKSRRVLIHFLKAGLMYLG